MVGSELEATHLRHVPFRLLPLVMAEAVHMDHRHRYVLYLHPFVVVVVLVREQEVGQAGVRPPKGVDELIEG